jgi:hypothetical protein
VEAGFPHSSPRVRQWLLRKTVLKRSGLHVLQDHLSHFVVSALGHGCVEDSRLFCNCIDKDFYAKNRFAKPEKHILC